MLPADRARIFQYVAGYFPDDFHVDVCFAADDGEELSIKIATPVGRLASFETTTPQVLDIMAMSNIAKALKMRVGFL